MNSWIKFQNKLSNKGIKVLAKQLKLHIKNTQIAEAINLGKLKSKLPAKKPKEEISGQEISAPQEQELLKEPVVASSLDEGSLPKEEGRKIRARSKSAFTESGLEQGLKDSRDSSVEEVVTQEVAPLPKEEEMEPVAKPKTSAEARQRIFGEELDPFVDRPISLSKTPTFIEELPKPLASSPVPPPPLPRPAPLQDYGRERRHSPSSSTSSPFPRRDGPRRPFGQEGHRPPGSTAFAPPRDKLGPTGRHIKDYARPPVPSTTSRPPIRDGRTPRPEQRDRPPFRPPAPPEEAGTSKEEAERKTKFAKAKEFRDLKPAKRTASPRQFDARDKQGLRSADEEREWRKKRSKSGKQQQAEEVVVRPTHVKICLPISVKDFAVELKLKASQLIGRLFAQGIVVTLNDLLDDETTVQLLGNEFGCEITVDTAEARRIQITDKSVKQELQDTESEKLLLRPPVVAFMGHVDHGKTSLIDAIRKSNRAAGEAGAITQHIGAFCCHTPVGDLSILDTPGHEAFSAMRARGADVTDIVVLVVAGDEGLRQQSIEALQHARAAGVIIVVAINKCDKPNFNEELVYRQLADQNLLPEAWGGQTITVNCSAVTGKGIQQLLEMLALQAEVLELKADPNARARGRVLESEMHKGLGAVATVLVQNGTLKKGDAVVFGWHWGRVKTMQDELGQDLEQAGPSTPVAITGLSGLPEAGEEFIVVKNEREAREIAGVRAEGARQSAFLLQQKKKSSMENLMQQTAGSGKKILNIVLRADGQGSLEALRVALLKIESAKAEVNIIFTGVGEISESDVQLAAASKAVILGFHTQIESHADSLVKELGVQVKLHDIIYHAVDDVKLIMTGLLEKTSVETERGKALVKATFKSSQSGMIAGCQVTEGSILRNVSVRVKRGNEVVWKGSIASLKRVKEDVREVQKGFECGILLNGFSGVLVGDVIESYEVTYILQEL